VPNPPKDGFTLIFEDSVVSTLQPPVGRFARGRAEMEFVMNDAISELKIRAKVLHRSVQAGHDEGLRRLRTSKSSVSLTGEAQHKHCLAAVAREIGFRSWQHAVRVLRGDDEIEDFGTLLMPRSCGGFLNQWYANYAEAREGLSETRYLLAYKRDFVIVTREFIAELGLDPDDPDWQLIGRDWVKPRDLGARRRLYDKLICRH